MLGRELISALHDRDVIGLSRSAEFDFAKKEDILAAILKIQPDVVINAIAYTDVNKAESEAEMAKLVNGYSVGMLAKACREFGVTLVNFSTDYVFDGKKAAGYAEDDTRKPLNVYGMSKALGEELLEDEMQLEDDTLELPEGKYFNIRTSYLFGLGKVNLVHKFLNLAKEGKAIKAAEDQLVTVTYAKDLARQVKWLLESNEFDAGNYHITNEGETSIFHLAKTILSKYGKENLVSACSLADFPATVVRPQYSVLKNSKLPNMRSWKEALNTYLEELNFLM